MVTKQTRNTLLAAFLALLGSILFLFASTKSVSAEQTVQKMDIAVQLDDSGAAHITEDWRVKADEGSEIYKTIKLVGTQSLANYSVSMDGRSFTPAAFWNINDGKSAKAYKYGQNGNELNWGISEYGTHDYQIKYTISNFVTKTTTDQMILWQFLEKEVEISPKDISITISDPKRSFRSDDGYGIWGFGFSGGTKFDNGKVVVTNSGSLSKSDYVKIMMQIPKDTYSTAYSSSRSFDDYVKEAFKGSDYNYEDYKSGKNIKNDSAIRWVISIIAVVVLLIVGLFIWIFRTTKNYRKYYPTLKKLEKQTKGEYYREIPVASVFELHWFFSTFLYPTLLNNNFLTAGLLALMKDGYVTLQALEGKEKRSQVSSKFVLTDKKPGEETPKPLRTLYNILTSAADQGTISQKALATYFKKHTKRYNGLAKDFYEYSTDYLATHGLITSAKKARKTADRKRNRANRIAKMTKGYVLTDQGIEVRNNLVRLKNYLLEFSLLNERTPQEVALWDDLMLAAAAFGILAEVEKELRQVYPGYLHESTYYSGTDYPFITATFYSHEISSSVSSSSSGGGGSTSIGGGGSSGGSSGGGGFR